MDNLIIASGSEKISFDGKTFVVNLFQSGTASAQHNPVRTGKLGMKNKGSILGVRKIKIVGYIIADGADPTEREKFLFEARRLLSRIVNPTGSFTLSRGKYSIECTPDASCEFIHEGGFFGENAEKFTISASCFNPCFSEEINVVSRANIVGELSFPVAVSEDFFFGLRQSAQNIQVENPGDIEAGCVIELQCETPVSRVRLELPSSGDYIEFNRNIRRGDTVVIDTRRGLRGITLISGGCRSNIISSLDWESTFFALQPGEHEILVDATGDDGKAYVNVKVSLVPQYLSL